ncbi:SagB family peptide dehydrogenase [Streptomyces sp. NPDC050421]|uniref:SagB family peptide dehydrogenase n=1 Tax=Streptomyces sp. NPDC050421 TaxID=3365613 RepID=UPI0037A37F4C
MRIAQLAGNALTELWSLRTDTTVHPAEPPDPAGRVSVLLVRTCWETTRVEAPSPQFVELLRRMQFGPVSPANVVDSFPAVLATAESLSVEAAALEEELAQVQGSVVRTLVLGATPLLSVVPTGPGARFDPRLLPPGRPRRLSRFAVLHSVPGGLCLQSPLSHHRVEVEHPGVGWLLGELGDGRAGAVRYAEQRPLAADAVEMTHAYLAAAAMVTPQYGNAYAEDTDPALSGWSAAELFVHTRSRIGKPGQEPGLTFAPKDRTAPAAPARDEPAGVQLPRPVLSRLRDTDPSLTEVLEQQGLTREFATTAPTLEQLGELLYRTARARAGGRPHPGQGGVRTLEIYVISVHCRDLLPGAYRYHPHTHRLEPVPGDREAADALLADARTTAGLDQLPPLLLVLTTRVPEGPNRHRPGAYTEVLKEVGALQQTLHLACTAMGLGAHVLTAGGVEAVAQALGLDWLAEPSVGEIILGLPARISTEN